MVDLSITIPDGFLNDEERNDYCVSSKQKEVWAIEIDLIQELYRVCKKHGLTCFAAYGTLIGALRDGGFIPWDDDVDFFMTRDEYDVLCDHADEFSFPYFFQTEKTDQGSCRGHAQLRNSTTTGALIRESKCLGINQGVFIDIFPIDKMIDNDKKLKIQLKRIKRWKYLSTFILKSAYMPDKKPGVLKIVKKVYRGVHRVFPFFDSLGNIFYKKYENECKRYNTIDTDRRVCFCFLQFDPVVLYEKEISESIRVPFEFVEILVPVGFDSILKRIYGDYHTPIHSGTVHGKVIFDTCRDYKTVLKNEYGNCKY